MSGPHASVTFSIRLASIAEIPKLQRIAIDADSRFVDAGHPELADGSTIPAEVAERAITQGMLYVAEVDREPVGWVYVGRIAGEPCVGHICVAPAFGRSGIGSALLQHIIDRARAGGDTSIVLNTQTDVAWGRRWYERHGFVVVERDAWGPALTSITRAQTRDGLDWSTRVHMRLRLEPLR